MKKKSVQMAGIYLPCEQSLLRSSRRVEFTWIIFSNLKASNRKIAEKNWTEFKFRTLNTSVQPIIYQLYW